MLKVFFFGGGCCFFLYFSKYFVNLCQENLCHTNAHF